MLNQSFCLHRKVFDDGNSLVEVFPSEVKDIMAACADVQRHSVRKVQMVVAASHWSHQLMSLVSQCAPHATAVFTCAIEAFIKAGGELVSVCPWDSAPHVGYACSLVVKVEYDHRSRLN